MQNYFCFYPICCSFAAAAAMDKRESSAVDFGMREGIKSDELKLKMQLLLIRTDEKTHQHRSVY